MGVFEGNIDGLSGVTLRRLTFVLVFLALCSVLSLITLLVQQQEPSKFRDAVTAIEPYLWVLGVLLAINGVIMIVTARKTATVKFIETESLRASEAEFRNLVSAVPVLTRVTDVDGKTTFVNTPWLTFTGRAMEIALGDGWLQSIHEEDRLRSQLALTDHLQSHAPFAIDYRLRRHDGVYRWMHDRSAPRFDAAGTFLGSISSCMDITEQHDKDSRVREVNEALGNALEGIATLDTNFNFTSINSAFASALGSVPQQLIEKPLAMAVFRDDLPLLDKCCKELKLHGKAECELRGIRSNGTIFFQRLTLVRRLCAHGEPLGSHCFMKDITDRHIAESSASELSTRFDSLASIAPVGIFHTDPIGNCLYVNNQWCRLAGMTPAEAVGGGWANAIHPDDRNRVFEEWAKSIQSGGEFRGEYRFKTPDGKVSHLLGASSPVKDGAGNITGYVGFVTDITQTKQSRDDLFSSLQKQLELLDREKSLRRELDHRVRNNLASLIGLVSLYERTDRSTNDLARTLRGQISAMKQVHETISRAGGGDVNIQTLFDTLRQSLVPQDAIDRVTLEGPTLMVSAPQAAALAMIVQELVTNSLKHGALTSLAGTISCKWLERRFQLKNATKSSLEIDWNEKGPSDPVTMSQPGTGVGIALIEGFAKTDLGGSVRFEKGNGHWRCYLVAELSNQPNAV